MGRLLRLAVALALGGLLGAPAPVEAAAATTAAADPPRRIVALDWGLAETLVALGVPPVAVADVQGYRDWVVEPALPDDVIDLGSRFEPNLELLQQIAPDVILTIPFQNTLKPLLARIAPVRTLSVYESDGPDSPAHPLARAEAVTRELGRLLDREQAAKRLIARTEATFTKARAALAPQADTPLYILSMIDTRHARIYGRGSLFQDVLGRLGLRNAWTGETNYWGFVTVGFERLATTPEAHAFVLEPVPRGVRDTLARSPLWTALPFVRAGRLTVTEPVLMFGTLPAAQRFARQTVRHLTGAPLTP